MIVRERRSNLFPERRTVVRGGRRPYDSPGSYPPILVAEGHTAARTPCVTYLKALRFEVTEAARPAEALEILDSGWIPKVILADSASSEAVSRHLTSTPRLLTSQLIVMSGSLGIARPRSSAVLVKPFHLKEMVQTIRRVLRRTPGSRARRKAK